MATDAQIRANRENAQKSCGPKSEAGKATASQNAAKHRMFAVKPVAGPEDEQEFVTLMECLRDQYLPETDIEMDLIQQMADSRWRYLRSCEEERALYNLDYKKYGASDPAAYDRGEAFIRLMEAKHLQYSRRCQRMFERKYEKSLAELRRIQAERRSNRDHDDESRDEIETQAALAEYFPGMSREAALEAMAAWNDRVMAPQSQSLAPEIGFVSANPESENKVA